MQCLPPQVLHLLLTAQVAPSDLLALSLTCRTIREACLPLIFAEVHWPHPNKNDNESGLHFFPESLWPYFKYVSSYFLVFALTTLQTIPSDLAGRLAGRKSPAMGM